MKLKRTNKKNEMKYYTILGLLLLSISSVAQYTPEPPQIKKYENGKEYFNSYLDDTKDLITSPFRWTKKDWIIAGTTVGIGAIVYAFDDNIRDLIQKNRTDFANTFLDNVAEPFGKGLYAIPIVTGLYLHGTIANNEKSKRVAMDAVKTYVLTVATVAVMKYTFKRHRPHHNVETDPRKWDGPFGDSQYKSFPSGHTAVAFSLATYFSLAYKDKLWVGITSYTMASLVGFQRIHSDNHWASDVLFGAVIGWSIGKLVFNKSLEKHNITLLPVSQHGIGLTLVKTFK
ncbi:MAG: phosphatase PAP2 family protein [Clostridia bacterium]|nr:phosphatase PAP2 family protein [Clostridia bacterium]